MTNTSTEAGTVGSGRTIIQRGNVRLAAVLMLPCGRPPFSCVVFVHGLGSGKDSPRNVVVATRLVDLGLAALLFDLSGHGESDADARPGEEPYIADLAAAFDWAVREPATDPQRIGIAGSSLGAVVALGAVRRRLICPAALVLRAPPVVPGDLEGINVPTLVIVGTRDPLLPQVRMAVEGAASATLSVVEGAGHLYEEPGALEEAVARTADWFSRLLLAGRPERRGERWRLEP